MPNKKNSIHSMTPLWPLMPTHISICWCLCHPLLKKSRQANHLLNTPPSVHTPTPFCTLYHHSMHMHLRCLSTYTVNLHCMIIILVQGTGTKTHTFHVFVHCFLVFYFFYVEIMLSFLYFGPFLILTLF